MKKTINIHIGGMPFIIDEEAYAVLHNYIEKLKSRFSNENERNEIITDIEARIAEVFAKRLDKTRQVVNEEDVAFIIEQLGKPEDIAGEETQNQNTNQESTSSNNGSYTSYRQYTQPGVKKLFRDGENKVAGGVISGLCQYFGITDPIWARIIFVLSFFAGFGTPVFVYLVFWLVIPEAVTTADKLQMKGEPVTLENIEKEVRDTVGRATDAFNRPINDSNIVGKIGTVLLLIAKGLLKVVSVFVFLGCLLALIVFLSAMFGVSFLGMKDLAPITELVLDSRMTFFVGFIGLFLTVGIPIFLIMYACGRFISSSRVPVNKNYFFPVLILWALGVAMFSYVEYKVGRNFKVEETRREQAELIQPTTDTLAIGSYRDTTNIKFDFDHNVDEEDAIGIIMNKDFLKTENGYIVGESEMELTVSQDSFFHLEKVVSASGRNKTDANKTIDMVNVGHKQEGNLILLNAWVEIFKNAKFRKQDQRNKVYIPEGKFVKIDNRNQIDVEIDGDEDFDSDDSKGKIFTNKNGKVVCVNCLKTKSGGTADEEDESEAENNDDEAQVIINKDSILIDGKNEKKNVHIHVGKNGVDITTK